MTGPLEFQDKEFEASEGAIEFLDKSCYSGEFLCQRGGQRGEMTLIVRHGKGTFLFRECEFVSIICIRPDLVVRCL